MISQNHNQSETNLSYIESQEELHNKKSSLSDPPYIRMLTSPWEVAYNAVEDINSIQELSSLSETSSGIDMKSGSTTESSTTIRSEDTNTSTLANISLDEDDPLQTPLSVIDDERPLSVHSISSVSVRQQLVLLCNSQKDSNLSFKFQTWIHAKLFREELQYVCI